MIEIESITVKLGEKEFAIKTAGFLRSKPWKKRLIDEVQPLFEQIGGVQNLAFDSPTDLLKLVPLLQSAFVDVSDKMCSLLISYSPVLEADKDYIEENATDKQILASFQEVLKLADPFGVTAMMTRSFGLAPTGT